MAWIAQRWSNRVSTIITLRVFCNRILDFKMCNGSMLRVDFSNDTVDIVKISDTVIFGVFAERERERERKRGENKAICCCSRYVLAHCDTGEIDDARKTHRWHYRAVAESFEGARLLSIHIESRRQEQSHSDVRVSANNQQNGGNVGKAGLRRTLGRWLGSRTNLIHVWFNYGRVAASRNPRVKEKFFSRSQPTSFAKIRKNFSRFSKIDVPYKQKMFLRRFYITTYKG